MLYICKTTLFCSKPEGPFKRIHGLSKTSHFQNRTLEHNNLGRYMLRFNKSSAIKCLFTFAVRRLKEKNKTRDFQIAFFAFNFHDTQSRLIPKHSTLLFTILNCNRSTVRRGCDVTIGCLHITADQVAQWGGWVLEV